MLVTACPSTRAPNPRAIALPKKTQCQSHPGPGCRHASACSYIGPGVEEICATKDWLDHPRLTELLAKKQ